MSVKIKKYSKRITIILFGAIIVIVLIGIVAFPRPDLPAIVTDDYCAQHGIRFDTSSIERIYSDPENILADPEKFLDEDQAYKLLAQSRVKIASPFRFETWLKEIEKLASYSQERREQEKPYRLSQLIIARQQSFCQEITANVSAYLPDETNFNATIYLTALDDPVPALANHSEGKFVFSLSHPLFLYAQSIHEPTGLSAFYNLGLHELFHFGFSEHFEPLSLEEHMENEVVIDMLISLQNEGMATYVSYELNPIYPTPFEWFLYLVDQEPVVRLYINKMNELFAVAQTKPTGEAYNEIYRRLSSFGYQQKGFYVVGAYMAMTIDNELGRDALVQTVSNGYESFADTYNTVADEDMKIRWRPEP